MTQENNPSSEHNARDGDIEKVDADKTIDSPDEVHNIEAVDADTVIVDVNGNDNTQLKRILEGAILAIGEPLSVDKMQDMFQEDFNEPPEKAVIKIALEQLQQQYQTTGFELIEVASGWRFQVCDDLAPWVNRLWEEKPQKYSRALLETLSLIAYRQPVTRGDIEDVRGVAVSSHITKTLIERDWVKIVGHRDVPGRPALYATTKQFLDYFNLKSLEELPSLGELQDIESLNEKFEFDESAQKNAQEIKEDSAENSTDDQLANVDVEDLNSDADGIGEDQSEPNNNECEINSNIDQQQLLPQEDQELNARNSNKSLDIESSINEKQNNDTV